MRTSSSDELRRQIRDNAYPGYVYGYPHKKAYRLLDEPRDLRDVWAGEERDRLFCYVHIPFCTQRCSFCNLFTYVPGDASPSGAYVEALGREMALVGEAIGAMRFARLYVGGGTPTFLTTPELRRLVAALRRRGPCFCIVFSDHGEAHGEDGRRGHRIAHPTVTTVPYANFLLDGPAPPDRR